MDTPEIRRKVAAMMPQVIDDLAVLVADASCAFPEFPPAPVHAACATVIDILRRAGFTARELDLEGGGYPAVWGEIPAPAGAPTVLLYAHYDVQPAPLSQGWTSDPWTLTQKDDGRLYGRGAADDKSGIAIHSAALRVFDGKPPVGIKVIFEGEEETISYLDAFVARHPAMFQADVMLVADMGNIECGEPVLTTTLRGHVQCIVETRTVDHPLHSGVFGGPAPDALMALIRLLATLQDERGNCAVPGLTRFDWHGAEYPEALYRQIAALPPGVEIIGDSSIASKLWSQPAVSVLGIDAPAVAQAGNVLLHSARAKVALRIAPGADPEHELDQLIAFLRAAAPWGVQLEITRMKAADAFLAPTRGPGMAAARAALAEAYGKEVAEVGSGGSIPLLETLTKASPGAEFILFGAEDARASIHGANESVDPGEIERMIIAEALLFQKLAGTS
jgi:acetylornithine deacetylase/succinyl-diaminopimelate desuccinylase-like protein